jgi:acetyltransferase-like isoleucine patch superfamily enzyme
MGDGSSTGAGAIVTRNTHIPAGEVYVGVPAKPLAARKQASASDSEAKED